MHATSLGHASDQPTPCQHGGTHHHIIKPQSESSDLLWVILYTTGFEIEFRPFIEPKLF